jgi:hypothetical protein
MLSVFLKASTSSVRQTMSRVRVKKKFVGDLSTLEFS